jgi:colicin import membrane protein
MATSEGGKKREAAAGEGDPKAPEADESKQAGGAEGGAADAAAGPGDEGEAEEPEEDQAAAGEAEETPAQRKARLAKDPTVAALIKAAVGKQVRDALAERDKEESKKAERAKLDAQARLEAEKADLAAERDKAATEAAEAKVELAFFRTMATAGLTLVNPKDMRFARDAAAEVMAETDLPLEEAMAQVAAERPHWFKKVGEPAVEDPAKKAAAAKAKADAAKKDATTTAAAAKGKGTEQTPEPNTKDERERVRGLAKADFAAELQQKYGVRIPTH